MSKEQPTTAHQFLRARALAARWGCHITTIWRMVNRGDLPKPSRLGPGVVAWRADVIERFESERTDLTPARDEVPSSPRVSAARETRPPASATIESLIADLAECYRLTGADPDGDEDWRLAPHAVAEVRRMRAELDAAKEAVDALTEQLKAAKSPPASDPPGPMCPDERCGCEYDGWGTQMRWCAKHPKAPRTPTPVERMAERIAAQAPPASDGWTPLGRLRALLTNRRTMPVREEYLGGQRTNYVQLDAVLAHLDSVQAAQAPPASDPPSHWDALAAVVYELLDADDRTDLLYGTGFAEKLRAALVAPRRHIEKAGLNVACPGVTAGVAARSADVPHGTPNADSAIKAGNA